MGLVLRPLSKAGFPGADVMREGVVELLKKKIKNFSHETRLCDDCLRQARADYIIKAFEYEKEDMTYLEKDVLSSIKKKDTISKNIYGKKKADFRRASFRHTGRVWRQLEIHNMLFPFSYGLDCHQHNPVVFFRG